MRGREEGAGDRRSSRAWPRGVGTLLAARSLACEWTSSAHLASSADTALADAAALSAARIATVAALAT